MAMLGCLAAHAAARINKPVHISLALNVTELMSARMGSVQPEFSTECLVRRKGHLLQRESSA